MVLLQTSPTKAVSRANSGKVTFPEFTRSVAFFKSSTLSNNSTISNETQQLTYDLQRLFVFSGDQVILLTPKGVELTTKERYNITRLNLYQLLDTLVNVPDVIPMYVDSIKEIQANTEFANDLFILTELINPILTFLDKYRTHQLKSTEFKEKMEVVQRIYSNLIPFLGSDEKQKSLLDYGATKHEKVDHYTIIRQIDQLIMQMLV